MIKLTKEKTDALFVPLFGRDETLFTHGRGSSLFDSNGKAYLDFGTGIAVNALGHGNRKLMKALHEQGDALIHLSNLYYTPAQIELAQLLVRHSFGKRVFFCNSGTEANEAAIKFARKHAQTISKRKYHILSFTDGFHGRTYGALSATAQPKFHVGFEPLVNGFHYAPFNDIDAVKDLFAKYQFAAVIIEPLQGEGGVNAADPKFIASLRKICDEQKALLVFDEVQCGMGRTGTLWNYEQYKVKPDIMALAKPLGGGLPLGAVVTTEEVALSMTPGDHGTTFGGNPVACALGTAVLSTVADKTFLKEVKEKGAYLVKMLAETKKTFPAIEGIRGKGLLIGVRMHDDPSAVIAACKENGLLLIKAGHNTVRFLPPLTVKKTEIDKAVRIFAQVLKKTFK